MTNNNNNLMGLVSLSERESQIAFHKISNSTMTSTTKVQLKPLHLLLNINQP